PFVVRADSPIKTGKDLIARIRQDPTSVSAGVASSGGANHMALGLVMKEAGIDVKKMKIVVFSSGGESLTALLGGHVDVVPTNPATIEPMLKSGKVRALGIAAERRLRGTYASVPTWREQGIDAVLMTWRGIVGPKGLTRPQIAYWEQVFQRMTRSEDWQADLRKSHWEDHYLDSAGTQEFFDA